MPVHVGVQAHWLVSEHIWPDMQVPHEPPQPSLPHCFPAHCGVHAHPEGNAPPSEQVSVDSGGRITVLAGVRFTRKPNFRTCAPSCAPCRYQVPAVPCGGSVWPCAVSMWVALWPEPVHATLLLKRARMVSEPDSIRNRLKFTVVLAGTASEY